MPLVMGDDWLQKLNCPLTTAPTLVHIREGKPTTGHIHYGLSQDAEAFHAWLVDAEEKVRDGFSTMRG